jgi:hypothetical protein
MNQTDFMTNEKVFNFSNNHFLEAHRDAQIWAYADRAIARMLRKNGRRMRNHHCPIRLGSENRLRVQSVHPKG